MALDPSEVGAWAGVAAVVVSVAALVAESRRSRDAQQVSLVLELQSRFHADAMRQRRREAAGALLAHAELEPSDPQWDKASEVLDFFQTLGTFARAGHVNVELMYKFFYFWLGPYWTACSKHIEHTQARSPVTWNDAKWLHESLRRYDRLYNSGALSAHTATTLQAFFNWEVSQSR